MEIRELGPEDAPAYEKDIGTDPAPTVERRLAAPGASCWIARSADRIEHASWVETDAAWMGEAERLFVVPPGDAYIYESFTRPEVRGRGIYPAVLAAIAERLGARGLARLWIAAEATNAPSLSAIQKAGFTHAFEIGVRRRLGRVSVTMPAGVTPQLRGCRE
jgi:GNAT superfamily N-acetyltransferase